jgi:hypothetical protein
MNVHRRVPVELRRRGFIKLSGAGLAASTLDAIGFGAAGEAGSTLEHAVLATGAAIIEIAARLGALEHLASE